MRLFSFSTGGPTNELCILKLAEPIRTKQMIQLSFVMRRWLRSPGQLRSTMLTSFLRVVGHRCLLKGKDMLTFKIQ